MTGKKLTDTEIKKALEYCSNPNNTCDKCILFNAKDDSCQCASNLRLQALDLINRLEKKNEAYKYYYEECLKDLKNANTENEKLKAKPIFVNSKIYDKQMEQKNIKAEARKEFAELVIKNICEQVNAPTPSESYIVEKCNQVIDETLKEMKENSN